MLRSMRSAPASATVRGRAAHDLGVLAEELDRDRPVVALVGVDAQHLRARLLVAVVDPEARDHLGDREPRAVALGLQAHEPVADARPAARARRGWGSSIPPSSQRSVERAHGTPNEVRQVAVALVEQPQAREREEVVDLVDCSVNGTMCSARPPVATTSTSSLPSSPSMRPMIPSTAAGVAVDDAGADRLDRRLADRRARRREVDLRQLRAALGQRLEADLDARDEHAAEVLARRRDDVEVHRGAEVDADRGPAVALAGSRPRSRGGRRRSRAGCRSGSASRSSGPGPTASISWPR